MLPYKARTVIMVVPHLWKEKDKDTDTVNNGVINKTDSNTEITKCPGTINPRR